jgi:hypothetical protein
VIWGVLILAALLAVAVLVAVQLGKSRAALARQVGQLGRELGARDHVIKAMEAANAKANERKDAMAAGTDRERFDASLGVLHDVAGGGAKPADAGVADVPGTGRRDPG